ncbi:LuxR C-terminal-related transcriptional regulator [Gordonia humi]|uniref:LuxR C-terminal-related transcriptional regulator n=1 Tax=Gordonia humi TaxID=686429 RepID=UPI0031E88238
MSCISSGRRGAVNADEWAQIRRCHDDGESIKGIAARLGMSRNTVRRALSLPSPPDDHRRHRGSVADDADRAIRDVIAREPEVTIAEIGRRIDWQHSRTLLARKVRDVRAENAVGAVASGSPGLPGQTTSFVGRRRELRELRCLLGESRLVSVVGPGGIGKSRVALQAAEEFRRAFPDGVRFVEFASVRSADLLSQTVCDALALETRAASDVSADDALIAYLRDRRMLLVLDNCEHVVDGAAELAARLLEQTGRLRILVTSRELLAVPGENVFHLQPLPMAADGAGAPELFARRASAVLSGFELDEQNVEAVQRICERLDGLPLAIELACTRLSVLSVHDLADYLDRRMSLLGVTSRDLAPRHRSLQATVDWSYELCTTREQLLWQRAAIFAGGFDLDAVEAVCTDDALPAEDVLDCVSALVAKSVLIGESSDGRMRFRMLETIRQYGWGKTPRHEQHRLHARLLDCCTRMIVDSDEHWYGPDQLAKATVVGSNRGNIRAALHWVMTTSGDPDAVAVAAEALGSARFLWACGISIREHRMWLTQALELDGVDARAKGRILSVLALVQTLQGDRDAAEYSVLRAREISAGLDPVTDAFAQHTAGLREFFAGDVGQARVLLDEAETRYRVIGGGPALLATLQVHRGMLLSVTQDVDAAEAAFTEVHDGSAAIGERWFHAYATYGLGLVALLRGEEDAAAELATEALSGHRDFGDVVGTTLMTDLLGWALAARGDGRRAAVVLGAASAMWGSVGRQLYGSERWNAMRTKALDDARRHCGEGVFDRAWTAGTAMSAADLDEFLFDRQVSPAPDTDDDLRLAGLSPREREVADLVAAGMTNREIAERLVLSTRTVEGHVEHLLGKLGLTRRTEVSAVVGAA